MSFVNQTPSAIWLVAAAKNAGVFYLMLKRRRHPWLDYAVLALLLWHAAVIYNGIAQLPRAPSKPRSQPITI